MDFSLALAKLVLDSVELYGCAVMEAENGTHARDCAVFEGAILEVVADAFINLPEAFPV